LHMSAHSRILALFQKYDKRGHGVIQKYDLVSILQQIGSGLTPARLDRALSEAGAGQDPVDYSLLLQWVYQVTRPVIIRYVSGELVHQESVCLQQPVYKLIRSVSEQTGTNEETLRLCSGATMLKRSCSLADCISGEGDEPVQLNLLRVAGPAVSPEAASGSRIQLQAMAPLVGSRCHFDRNYKFSSLGGFADNPMMRYIITSNEDKLTPPHQVMWSLTVHMPVTVYLNFRSDWHVSDTGAAEWLARDGWQHRADVLSTISTGFPNGPYSGPVYSKMAETGFVKLMGSNCNEGVYFVFVEIEG